jgi:hypothetical protein
VTASWNIRKSLLLGAIVALVVAAQAVGGVAFAGQNAAGGNRGVVKIDDVPFDEHPDNEPHVGCRFQIDLTGFPSTLTSVTVLFSAHHPTLRESGDQVLVRDTLTLSEGQRGTGGSKTYSLDLDGITPHDQQGFHVKLTILTGHGAGKHKVFWVRDCGTPSSSTSTTTPTETSEGGDDQDHPTTTTSEEREPTGNTAPPATTVLVAGESGTPPPGGGSELPFTGAGSVQLLTAAGVLLLSGVLLLMAGRVRGARVAARRTGSRRPPG